MKNQNRIVVVRQNSNLKKESYKSARASLWSKTFKKYGDKCLAFFDHNLLTAQITFSTLHFDKYWHFGTTYQNHPPLLVKVLSLWTSKFLQTTIIFYFTIIRNTIVFKNKKSVSKSFLTPLWMWKKNHEQFSFHAFFLHSHEYPFYLDILHCSQQRK